MKHIKIALLIALISFVKISTAQEKYTPDWENLKKHKAVPEWFADAKLGIYFHWGVYSVPAKGGEWYARWMYVPDRENIWGSEIYEEHRATYGENFDYHDFIPMWKAPKFDAKEWVDLFEGMGAKFIGSIAEHHDGFSLWDSKVNEWNSANMGPHINVVKAIAEETNKRGLKFMATFHHGFHNMFYPKPENSYLRPVSKYNLVYDNCEVPQDEKYRKLYCNMDYDEANDLWLGKLNEVINEFCPDYIWMDFGQRFIKESHRKQFLANYFNKAAEENKEVVVNTKGDFFPTELAVVNVERATMEDITPEVWITDFILGSSWCYDKTKRTAIKPKIAIRMLAEVVSKNGVMLLSAGPMADGTIPEEQVKAMQGIGAWMKLYGEAIYNTRPFVAFGEGTTELKRDPEDAWNEYGAIKQGLSKLNAEDVRYTKKGNTVYAIQLGWNDKTPERTLATFSGKAKDLKIKSVSVLGSSETIKWKKTKAGLQVQQPNKKPAEADAALVYKIILK
ncbi:alpha-L-fucosidase [Labilibaculum antarcticum]|uniref:alpha-L-fucosidase n=1 Tax=Labilibaculum antarcticum TaxID=1717717 RepID=A0A1Y1CGQ6_9BACT|nr:alpha-L-fucosidase [Labilibaculum antarcticum]BAX78471.1 alpha-L-fucosidase [Labilibaculum antarcticum]